MATSKTLTPTNVTIQIPAMTDAPDQSVNSNCIDKLGDAVNTLNSQLDTASISIKTSNSTTFTFSGLHNISNTTMFKHGLLVWGTGASDANVGMSIVFVGVDGTVMIKNVSGTGRTFTGSVSNGVLTITASYEMYGGLKLIWLT